MKRVLGAIAALIVLLGIGVFGDDLARSQPREGRDLQDAGGSGFNGGPPDADGDGIPNGRDPDYVRPADCSGYAKRFAVRGGKIPNGNPWRRYRSGTGADDRPRAEALRGCRHCRHFGMGECRGRYGRFGRS